MKDYFSAFLEPGQLLDGSILFGRGQRSSLLPDRTLPILARVACRSTRHGLLHFGDTEPKLSKFQTSSPLESIAEEQHTRHFSVLASG